MANHAAFKLLFGELMPVTVLRGFHEVQLQTQLLVGKQVRHYAVLGEKGPGASLGSEETCDLHVFEVAPNPEAQDRLAWSAALAHEVAKARMPELFQRPMASPNELLPPGLSSGVSQRRGGTIMTASCNAKVVLAHHGPGAKGRGGRLLCCPKCHVPLHHADLRGHASLPAPQSEACAGLHFKGGLAQCGWWVVGGALLHSGGCVDRGCAAQRPRQMMTPGAKTTLEVGQRVGLTSAQAIEIATAVHGRDELGGAAKKDVRNELAARRAARCEAPGSKSVYIAAPGGASAANYLQGLNDEVAVCYIALYSVIPPGASPQEELSKLETVAILVCEVAAASAITASGSRSSKKMYDITRLYESCPNGGPQEWSVAEHVLLRLLNGNSATGMPTSMGQAITSPQEVVIAGAMLRPEAVVTARYDAMRRAWRAMESQGVDSSGCVCNISNGNLLALVAQDAEGKQLVVLTGMLFSLQREHFAFAFKFAYPLVFGRATYSHNFTSTDGDPNEYQVVEQAGELARVRASARAAQPRASATVKGHANTDQFGRTFVYSPSECVWALATRGSSLTVATAVDQCLAEPAGAQGGHIGGSNHMALRDYFHAVVMPHMEVSKTFTGYAAAMSRTALDWVKRIEYNGVTPTEVSAELDQLVAWLQNPDRSICHRHLEKKNVQLPQRGQVLRDPEQPLPEAMPAASRVTAAIPTKIYDFRPSKTADPWQGLISIHWAGSGSSEDSVQVTLASAGMLAYVGYRKLREQYSGPNKTKLPPAPATLLPAAHQVEEDDAVYSIREICDWSNERPAVITVVFDGFDEKEQIPIESAWQSDDWGKISAAWVSGGGEVPLAPGWMKPMTPIGSGQTSAGAILNWLKKSVLPFQPKLARCYFDSPQGAVVGTTGAEAFFTFKSIFGGKHGVVGTQRPLERLREVMELLACQRERERRCEYQRRYGKRVQTDLPGLCGTVLTKKAIELAEPVFWGSDEDCFEVLMSIGTPETGSLLLKERWAEKLEPGAPWDPRGQDKCEVKVAHGIISCDRHRSFYQRGITPKCVSWCMNRKNFRPGWLSPRWLREMVCVETTKVDNILWHDQFQADFDAPKGIAMVNVEEVAWRQRHLAAPRGSSSSSAGGGAQGSAQTLGHEADGAQWADEHTFEEGATEELPVGASCYYEAAVGVEKRAQYGKVSAIFAKSKDLLGKGGPKEVDSHYLERLGELVAEWQGAKQPAEPPGGWPQAGRTGDAATIAPLLPAANRGAVNVSESSHPYYMSLGARAHGRHRGGRPPMSLSSRGGAHGAAQPIAAKSGGALLAPAPVVGASAPEPGAGHGEGDGRNASLVVVCCVRGTDTVYWRCRRRSSDGRPSPASSDTWEPSVSIGLTTGGEIMSRYGSDFAATHGTTIPRANLRAAWPGGYTCAAECCQQLPQIGPARSWGVARALGPGLAQDAGLPPPVALAGRSSSGSSSDGSSDGEDETLEMIERKLRLEAIRANPPPLEPDGGGPAAQTIIARDCAPQKRRKVAPSLGRSPPSSPLAAQTLPFKRRIRSTAARVSPPPDFYTPARPRDQSPYNIATSQSTGPSSHA